MPAALPGRLAAVGMNSPLAASVRQRAAQEDVFRSQSAAARRRAGLPAAPPSPSRVWTSAAVPWRTDGVLTASATRAPFYRSQADEEAAVRAFEHAAGVIAHGEAGSLPGEPLSPAQEGMCHSYAKLMTAGAIDQAARVLGTLRDSAGRTRQQRIRGVMHAMEVAVKGEAGALVASVQRRQRAQLDRKADRILGPEKAARIRQMRALRQRVDRLRGGSGDVA